MHGLSWELLCEPDCLGISVLRVASGARAKLASCKSALNLPVVYSTDHSKAVVPVLVLLCFAFLRFILRGDWFCLTLCCFVLVFSVLLALRLSRLEKCFSYVCSISACFVLSVSFSSWCLERPSVCDCGTSWIFLLPFLNNC